MERKKTESMEISFLFDAQECRLNFPRKAHYCSVPYYSTPTSSIWSHLTLEKQQPENEDISKYSKLPCQVLKVPYSLGEIDTIARRQKEYTKARKRTVKPTRGMLSWRGSIPRHGIGILSEGTRGKSGVGSPRM